jgi:hypothetical protein
VLESYWEGTHLGWVQYYIQLAHWRKQHRMARQRKVEPRIGNAPYARGGCAWSLHGSDGNSRRNDRSWNFNGRARTLETNSVPFGFRFAPGGSRIFPAMPTSLRGHRTRRTWPETWPCRADAPCIIRWCNICRWRGNICKQHSDVDADDAIPKSGFQNQWEF